MQQPKVICQHVLPDYGYTGNRLKIVKPGITLPDYQSYSLFSAEINSLNINKYLKTK
jgi:hypothetical protein